MASQPRLLVNSRTPIFSLGDGILGWTSAVVQGREAMVWGGTPNDFQVPKMASKDNRQGFPLVFTCTHIHIHMHTHTGIQGAHIHWITPVHPSMHVHLHTQRIVKRSTTLAASV